MSRVQIKTYNNMLLILREQRWTKKKNINLYTLGLRVKHDTSLGYNTYTQTYDRQCGMHWISLRFSDTFVWKICEFRSRHYTTREQTANPVVFNTVRRTASGVLIELLLDKQTSPRTPCTLREADAKVTHKSGSDACKRLAYRTTEETSYTGRSIRAVMMSFIPRLCTRRSGMCAR